MTNVSIPQILAVICKMLFNNLIWYVLKCIGSSNFWMTKFVFKPTFKLKYKIRIEKIIKHKGYSWMACHRRIYVIFCLKEHFINNSKEAINKNQPQRQPFLSPAASWHIHVPWGHQGRIWEVRSSTQYTPLVPSGSLQLQEESMVQTWTQTRFGSSRSCILISVQWSKFWSLLNHQKKWL